MSQILKLDEKWGDWDVYGKTGGGSGKRWFIGWIQKQEHQIAFVQYLEIDDNDPRRKNFMGFNVKEVAKKHLQEIGYDISS